MNLRPSGYEPDELPDCSTPHQKGRAFYTNAAEWEAVAELAFLATRQPKALRSNLTE